MGGYIYIYDIICLYNTNIYIYTYKTHTLFVWEEVRLVVGIAPWRGCQTHGPLRLLDALCGLQFRVRRSCVSPDADTSFKER